VYLSATLIRYVGDTELIPTPPGSGLRFELAPSGELAISFVYPVYTGTGAVSGAGGSRQNMTGILEAAPVVSAVSSAGAVPSNLDELRARVTDGLSRHEDARRCYERARAVRS
jgi:hypothetical protein